MIYRKKMCIEWNEAIAFDSLYAHTHTQNVPFISIKTDQNQTKSRTNNEIFQFEIHSDVELLMHIPFSRYRIHCDNGWKSIFNMLGHIRMVST